MPRRSSRRSRSRHGERSGSRKRRNYGKPQRRSRSRGRKRTFSADERTRKEETFGKQHHKRNRATMQMRRNTTQGLASSHKAKPLKKVPVPDLPIQAFKTPILDAVREHDFVICVGETGSGKTTQVPQYLLDMGPDVRIAATQPRRVAAVSVARRVAAERGVALGSEVGYTIRFDDCTSRSTALRYMTDGVLVRECARDPLLLRYSHVVLDEAHERSVHTDVLLGLLKALLPRRRTSGHAPLKVLVTSATLDHGRFAAFLGGCPVLEVPGRSHPVAVYHAAQPASAQTGRYVRQAVDAAFRIHLREAPGDVLVFLTGQAEIESARAQLRERWEAEQRGGTRAPGLRALGLYGALPGKAQQAVFEPAPAGVRKVIFATNIAETSLTVEGVRYVVDPGFVKHKVFQPDKGVDALLVVPVSQTAAIQRAGRAGRTQDGKCYRLYSTDQFAQRDEDTVPEIERASLVGTVLQLKALGVRDVLGFDFLDPPKPAALREALRELRWLGALDQREEGLTPLGAQLARLPVEPALGRVLLEAARLGCLREGLAVAAMLSVENVLERPGRGERAAQEAAERRVAQKHAVFMDPGGDALTLLNVYTAWDRAGRAQDWCEENHVNARAMKRAHSIRGQLDQQVREIGLTVASGNKRAVRQAVCAGYLGRAAVVVAMPGTYRALVPAHDGSSRIVQVDPNSVYAVVAAPMYVVYTEAVATTKLFMRNITAVEEPWVRSLKKSLKNSRSLLEGETAVEGSKEDLEPAKADDKMSRAPVAAASVADARARYLARKALQK